MFCRHVLIGFDAELGAYGAPQGPAGLSLLVGGEGIGAERDEFLDSVLLFEGQAAGVGDPRLLGGRKPGSMGCASAAGSGPRKRWARVR